MLRFSLGASKTWKDELHSAIQSQGYLLPTETVNGLVISHNYSWPRWAHGWKAGYPTQLVLGSSGSFLVSLDQLLSELNQFTCAFDFSSKLQKPHLCVLIWWQPTPDLVWNRHNVLILIIRNTPYLRHFSIHFISSAHRPLWKVLICKQQRGAVSHSKNSSQVPGEFDTALCL